MSVCVFFFCFVQRDRHHRSVSGEQQGGRLKHVPRQQVTFCHFKPVCSSVKAHDICHLKPKALHLSILTVCQ